MSVKKISHKTIYEIEIDQDQLDKLYAILSAVDDDDTDKLCLQIEEHVEDASLTLFDGEGADVEHGEVR